jgi:hypothetical protein
MLYTGSIFRPLLDTKTRTGSQGYVLSGNVGAPVFFRQPLDKMMEISISKFVQINEKHQAQACEESTCASLRYGEGVKQVDLLE